MQCRHKWRRDKRALCHADSRRGDIARPASDRRQFLLGDLGIGAKIGVALDCGDRGARRQPPRLDRSGIVDAAYDPALAECPAPRQDRRGSIGHELGQQRDQVQPSVVWPEG